MYDNCTLSHRVCLQAGMHHGQMHFSQWLGCVLPFIVVTINNNRRRGLLSRIHVHQLSVQISCYFDGCEFRKCIPPDTAYPLRPQHNQSRQLNLGDSSQEPLCYCTLPTEQQLIWRWNEAVYQKKLSQAARTVEKQGEQSRELPTSVPRLASE